MAETELYTMIKNNNPQVVPANPNKMYTHFLYKAVFVSMFLLLVPLFRCEVPDFMNQTIINTRSWELVQLVFVGIAVSYGLFSKRNKDEETQKGEQEEEGWSCCRIKSDHNAYVARLLQVSSVFDDDDEDSETPSGSGSGSGCDANNNSRNSKVQTWNSQYYRGEPILVVAKDTSFQQAAAVEKPPLLLPVVGSLKNECFSRSNSRRNLSKVTRGSTLEEEEEEEENIVLRSPIPWRSRSAGRMDPDFTQQTPCADPPSLSQIQSKLLQDDNKSSFSPVPPPPPPPPPPQVNLTNTYYSPKEFRRNGRSFSENDFHNNNKGRRRTTSGVTTPTDHIYSPLPAKSKSFTSPKQTEYLLHDNEIESFIQTRGSQSNNTFMTTHHHHDTQQYYPKQEFMELTNKDHVEESEDDELQQLASKNNINGEMDVNGPDVDKKADEFIAKFREQIRLQRIASIRTSTTTAQTPPK